MGKISIHRKGERLCAECKSWKSIDDFTKHLQGKDGIGSRCKECDKERSKVYRLKNKDKIKKARRLKYLSNPQKDHEHGKKWRENNRDRVNELERLRYVKNPFPAKMKDYKRRAILKSSGHITSKEWKELCNKFENRCLKCRKDNLPLTIDHIMPLKLGGKNEISNVQPLCFSCNSSKGAKFIDYRIGLT